MKITIDHYPTVYVSKRIFGKLMNYSRSIPTGTTIGKWWKAENRKGGWIVGAYAESEDPTKVSIIWRNLDWLPWLDEHEVVNGNDLPELNHKASFH